MGDYENVTGGASYTVTVSPDVAFTVIYEDAQGRLLFSIEVGDDPNTIFVNSWPSQDERMIEASDDAMRTRVDRALARVKAYFEAKGLTVEVDWEGEQGQI
jgi:hypothetical protein